MKTGKLILSSLGVICATLVGAQTVTTYNYTGAPDVYIVPAGVTSIHVEMIGASGGICDYSGTNPAGYIPGMGGKLECDLAVIPGSTLNVYVGGQGSNASSGTGGTGGYNGGGNGGTTGTYSGGGGGGASDLRLNGTALTDRVLVAGGGGGSAYNYGCCDNGGNGGDLTGANCQSNSNPADVSTGKGGSQVAGGLAGQWSGYSAGTNGVLGIGGNGGAGTSGGGAGGGYYGGGGGSWAGGGGGSSYTNVDASNIVHTQGFNTGNGQIIITVFCTAMTTSVSATTVCEFDFVTLSAVSTQGGNVVWDNGVVDNVPFQGPGAGVVTYTADSDHPDDCDFSVDITFLPAPDITLSTSDDFGNDDGGVYITINDGLFPFTYDWDNDGTGDFDDSQNITGLPAGVYTVVVEHANGCQTTASATVNSQVGIEDESIEFSVYPNPASDVMMISAQGQYNYTISDLNGRVIIAGNGTNNQTISVGDLSAGSYIITISTDNGVSATQFVKQ
ncbi:MAG: T9SS type A sorting domain-containing protein [Crocinitomicaceae bacterium]|nr:T9SS type A sorting domain-containing protein [Crocinitomicaceae bacterium]